MPALNKTNTSDDYFHGWQRLVVGFDDNPEDVVVESEGLRQLASVT